MGGWRWLQLLALLSSVWLAACGSGSSGFDSNPACADSTYVPRPGECGTRAYTFEPVLPSSCVDHVQNCPQDIVTSAETALQVATDPAAAEGGMCQLGAAAALCRFPLGVFLRNVPATATVRLATRQAGGTGQWQLSLETLEVERMPFLHLEDAFDVNLPEDSPHAVVAVDIAVLIWLIPRANVPVAFSTLQESHADFAWQGHWHVQGGS